MIIDPYRFGGPGATLPVGLVAYWPLDEVSDGSSGVSRQDVSGNGLHLTDNSPFAASASGWIGNGVQFVAANSENLTREDSASLSIGSSDFTFLFRVKLASTSDQTFVSKWNSVDGEREYALMLASNRFTAVVNSTGTGAGSVALSANSFGAPSVGVWYFIAVRRSAGALSIAVNGTADSVGYASDVFDGAAVFSIGSQSGVGSFANATIDEVRFWKRGLSDAEVAYVYALS